MSVFRPHDKKQIFENTQGDISSTVTEGGIYKDTEQNFENVTGGINITNIHNYVKDSKPDNLTEKQQQIAERKYEKEEKIIAENRRIEQAAKNGYVFFKIYENNEKSRFSSNLFQNIFQQSGFKITKELNRAAYVLDVSFDLSSSDTPIYEGGQSKPRFVNVDIDVNKISTKENIYSTSSSGVYPHISESQGHQIAAKKAIDKIKSSLVKFLSQLKK